MHTMTKISDRDYYMSYCNSCRIHSKIWTDGSADARRGLKATRSMECPNCLVVGEVEHIKQKASPNIKANGESFPRASIEVDAGRENAFGFSLSLAMIFCTLVPIILAAAAIYKIVNPGHLIQ